MTSMAGTRTASPSRTGIGGSGSALTAGGGETTASATGAGRGSGASRTGAAAGEGSTTAGSAERAGEGAAATCSGGGSPGGRISATATGDWPGVRSGAGTEGRAARAAARDGKRPQKSARHGRPSTDRRSTKSSSGLPEVRTCCSRFERSQ